MKTLYTGILLTLGFLIVKAQKMDVIHIGLTLQFDWKKKQAFGEARITLIPAKGSKSIALDAGMLTVNSVVLLDGSRLTFDYNGGDKDNGLEILLDKPYASDLPITLVIDYHTNYQNQSDPNNIGGSFGKGLRFFEPTYTTPTKRRQIWSSGEPDNNRYWYPCNEDIADIHTTSLTATVEKPLMVIANGNLVKTTSNPDGTQTFQYEANDPHPNYLNSIVVGEYLNVKKQSFQIPINNFIYPDEKEAAEATVTLLPDMMQFISEKTGLPYPYKQYSQVVVQDYPFPGLNGQHGVSTISDSYIDDYGVHEDFKYLWDGVAVQALASQWFGNLMMPETWSDIWLNNAFTQYFAGLYTAKNNGKEEYLTYYLPFEQGNVLNDWNTGYKHPIVLQEGKEASNFTSDNYSKFRGALVLRMLQHELGEKDWWKAIEDYVKSNTHKQVSTSDFQKAIEKISGKSYQWFFDQWLYKTGLPKFVISKKYEPGQLTITLNQVQQRDTTDVYPQVAYFGGKASIEINNKIEVVEIKPQQENNFIFPLTSLPKLVNFDYEDVWICEKTFEKTTAEWLYQAANDVSVSGKVSAINALAAIAGNESTPHEDKVQIYCLLRNQVAGQSYWRYRFYALTTLRNLVPLPYDDATINLLQSLIEKEESWVKTAAISMLGNTKEAKYTEVYIHCLNDKSDRVINAAANALGKTKSPKAFDILLSLEQKPSWKNQNRIAALNGLQQLGDGRAADYALQCLQDNHSPGWYLATPVWDYPFAAANTLVALGKGDLGYPIIFDRFRTSMAENDVNDIFRNVQLLIVLADRRGETVFEILNEKYKDDAFVMASINTYETQFKQALNK